MNHSVDNQRRPSPEALLQTAEQEVRSRLKIFIGAAPGVGKTYAMLAAAQERRREGADVVVGIVETHGRAETQALLQGLEILPRKRVVYRGTTLEEMDLDAILTRRPQLVLVDELAHSNAPTSRHAKRCDDVIEILDAGIDVFATVNIQHLESLNDVVAQITGIRVRETVPDKFFERADEMKLVDVTPEDLLQRLREGKVYMPDAAERAIRNYFQLGNLTALRELALRHTAERVDKQMRVYMQAHAVPSVWPVAERIMVAVSSGALAERLVRSARRLVDRSRAQWLVVFVETAAFHRMPEAAHVRVNEVLRLAERLGGEAVIIPGDNIAAELLRYAQHRNVTEIVLGKPARAWWQRLWHRSPVYEVLRHSGDIDVRVISAESALDTTLPSWTSPARRTSLTRYLGALACVAVAGATAKLLQQTLALTDYALVFLTGVLFSAVMGGLRPSILAALVSVIAYDVLFVEPLYTLNVTNPQDVLSLLVFVVVAVLTSHLTSRNRDQAAAARQREARTSALYAFSRQLAAATGVDELAPIIVEHVGEELHATAALLLPGAGGLALRAVHPVDAVVGEPERAAATWVYEHNRAAGRGSDTLAANTWMFVPLSTVRGVVGTLALLPPGKLPLPLDQCQLLEALARQAAVAIERARVDIVLEEKAKTEAILESSEDGLIVLDPAGIVVHVNEVACAILEVERHAALGHHFDNLGAAHPHYLRLRAALREFQAHPEHEAERIEIALFLRGRDHYFLLRPTPFHSQDGSDSGWILALQDVTYLRDQEARREELMATLSHEMGTPLTSLGLAQELLAQQAALLDSNGRELLETVREDVLRLQDLGKRLLDLSRTRAMTIALDRIPVNIAEIVGRVLRIFAPQARDKGVRLEDATATATDAILGDATKLMWAFSNLISNALRYTPSGGLVKVELRTSEESIYVSVSDTGPGIRPEDSARIFERWAQMGDGGESGASGLGLAIVRDIVQAHDGRIRLEANAPCGSRFVVELPRSDRG